MSGTGTGRWGGGAVHNARRPPAPTSAIAAWALAILGPVVTRLLVLAIVPEDRCGTWGLQCAFYLFLGASASWCVGTGLAVRGTFRGELRWLAVSGLVVNLLPLLLLAVFVLRILIR